MATTTLITAAEYLRSSYKPDADFVDGRIEERVVGERDHSDLQKRLLLLLSAPEMGTYFECLQELRVQVSPERYRVPDLCVLRSDAPIEQVVLTPPLLCIEILSPDDTMPRTMVRVEDFLRMGVSEVWVWDSESRCVQVCAGNRVTKHRSGYLPIPTTPYRIVMEEVFSVLDRRVRS